MKKIQKEALLAIIAKMDECQDSIVNIQSKDKTLMFSGCITVLDDPSYYDFAITDSENGDCYCFSAKRINGFSFDDSEPDFPLLTITLN